MLRFSVWRIRGPVLVLSVLMAALAAGLGVFMGDAHATPHSAPIPRTPDEALQRLDAILPPPLSEAIHGGGEQAELDRARERILREWISPPGSPLTAYFREQGLDHPEDIPGILLACYRRRLSQTSINLDGQVKDRQACWRGVLTPEKVAAAEELAERAMHDPTLLEGAYRQIATLVTNDFDGGDLDMLSPPLLLREWSLLDAWVIQQVEEQPPAAAAAYPQIIARLDASLEVLTVDLGTDTTLLAIKQHGMGHVAIIQKGQAEPLWRVDRIPEDSRRAAALSCWRAEAGIRPCAPWRVGPLPADAQGRRRFYIEAEYAQPSGAAGRRQLSAWRWDGRAATPLYVTTLSMRWASRDRRK